MKVFRDSSARFQPNFANIRAMANRKRARGVTCLRFLLSKERFDVGLRHGVDGGS